MIYLDSDGNIIARVEEKKTLADNILVTIYLFTLPNNPLKHCYC